MTPGRAAGKAAGGGRGRRRVLPGALLALLPVAAACASVPDRPDPVSPGPAVEVESDAGRAAAVEVPVLRERSYPVPPRPWFRPGVHLSPSRPRAGTALGVTVSTPCVARRPREVEGRLGEQTIRFGRLGAHWFGMAALAPEGGGERELALRYHLSEDSTVSATVPVSIRDRTYPANRLSVAPRYSTPPDSVRERIERERRLVADLLSRSSSPWLLTDDVRWPRPPRVTSSFGEKRTFNDEVRSRHWGVDLRGRTGDPVRAAARGRVALVRDLYYAGRAVYLDHGHGVFTGYFHLSRARAPEGRMVEAGEVIGEVGATGRVTGPHLHWALYVNGVHVDARSLLSLEIPPPGGPGRTACSLPG